MRLVYLGTPEMAVAPLRALHDAGHEVVLVVTGADKRRGRRGAPTPSPVKAAATELGLAVSHDPDDLLGVDAELGVVVAYGRLLRPHLLAHLDMVNLHFSLLPRWRGAAPVERALLAGDPVTGVCVMKVDEGLDTGCVYERAEVPIEAHTTAAELRSRLVEVGCELLVHSLADGLGTCTPQDAEGVTYASKLDRNDLHLDWSLPGAQLDRVVRLGGAWTTFRGETFKVHEATIEPAVGGLDGVPGTVVGDPRSIAVRTGDGLLRLQRVQPAGKAAMAAADWVNGARPVGEVLGDSATEGS
jgi:methionyl-tRNA formyltransferase